MTSASSAVNEFRTLHETGCFIIPNAWDIGSAVYLHHLGFRAIATTSAGFAFSRGRPDLVSALTCEGVLAHAREIAGATTLPVNVDFQHGYADDSEGVAANVAACLQTGAAGLSVEDATGDPSAPLFDRDVAIARVRAACAARDATQPQAVLTARCEAWLVGDASPARTAIDRLVAFAEAGADCLFAPGVSNPAVIADIVQAVAPKPVNVLVSQPSPDLTLAKLADLGVRRISVGSALARVAWGAFMRSAQAIMKTGEFDGLQEGASFEKLNELFAGRGRP